MQNKNKLTDDRLVAAYAQGDNEAFDILLRRHRNRVFSYIYSIVKNRDIANDIFQETFVKAITTIRQGKYAETGKFFAWISRIAHNLIIQHYPKNKIERLVSVDDSESDILNRRDLADTNIEDSLVYEQINDDLHRLIDELPENQQEVLRMRYFKDMSFKEIADATNVSINTALGRMRYALINLRRIAAENEIALTV